MKKILSVFSIALIAMEATAQNGNYGVYLNYDQFINNKPEIVSNGNTKVRLNQFSNSHFITVRQDGQKTRLFKDEVYAYTSKNGEVLRYQDETPYRLLERGIVWMYYRDITLPGKGIRTERRYYYSVGGNDKILPLTKWNLKNSFPGKDLFQNFLDAQFRSDAELPLYNSYAKEYQINHLLNTTVIN